MRHVAPAADPSPPEPRPSDRYRRISRLMVLCGLLIWQVDYIVENRSQPPHALAAVLGGMTALGSNYVAQAQRERVHIVHMTALAARLERLNAQPIDDSQRERLAILGAIEADLAEQRAGR